jgi:hypothetical protein
MKFLCVPCDTPMKLIETRPPDRGSVSLVYSCPSCGYEFAMLTNPYETQIVGSLGVEVAPERATRGTRAGSPAEDEPGTAEGGATGQGDELPWTAEARERLTAVPEFVRPMAKTGIERYAKDNGHTRVDEKVLEAAREFFGM